MSQVVTMNGYKHLLVGVARSWNIFIPSSNLRACLGGLLTEGSLCGARAEATELQFGSSSSYRWLGAAPLLQLFGASPAFRLLPSESEVRSRSRSFPKRAPSTAGATDQ